jgi:hypothetical protein
MIVGIVVSAAIAAAAAGGLQQGGPGSDPVVAAARAIRDSVEGPVAIDPRVLQPAGAQRGASATARLAAVIEGDVRKLGAVRSCTLPPAGDDQTARGCTMAGYRTVMVLSDAEMRGEQAVVRAHLHRVTAGGRYYQQVVEVIVVRDGAGVWSVASLRTVATT